jgi:hypothetical protein
MTEKRIEMFREPDEGVLQSKVNEFLASVDSMRVHSIQYGMTHDPGYDKVWFTAMVVYIEL